MTTDTAIVGLGVGGLGCAFELTRGGRSFMAFDKADRPGGLARTERVGEFRFDVGPHIILGIPPPLASFFSMLDLDLTACTGRSSIVLGGRHRTLVPAPLQWNLNYLPLRARASMLFEWLAGRRAGDEPRNYAEFARARCGNRLYHLFLQPYECKRLRFPLHDIAADWTSRVAAPSLPSLVLPVWATRRRAETRADASFLYPCKEGIEALPRAIYRLLPQERVQCGRELREIDVKRKRIAFASGPDCEYNNLVLSLPLPEIVERIVGGPTWLSTAARDLVFTSVHVVNLGIDGDLDVPGTILRFADERIGFYRLSFPSRFDRHSAPAGCTSIVAELSHHPQRHAMSRGEARRCTLDGLARLALLPRGRRIFAESIHTVRYGHVVHTGGTGDSVRRIVEYLNAASIYTCGKYGRWRDMLMPEAIASGMTTARQIMCERAIVEAVC